MSSRNHFNDDLPFVVIAKRFEGKRQTMLSDPNARRLAAVFLRTYKDFHRARTEAQMRAHYERQNGDTRNMAYTFDVIADRLLDAAASNFVILTEH